MCDGAPAPCSSSWRRSQIQFENPYCASSGPKKRENGSVGLRYAGEETGIVVSLLSRSFTFANNLEYGEPLLTSNLRSCLDTQRSENA